MRTRGRERAVELPRRVLELQEKVTLRMREKGYPRSEEGLVLGYGVAFSID